MDIALHSDDCLRLLRECLVRFPSPATNELAPPRGRELLRWLLSRLDRFGITRVGELTGLDRLGIPVMQACRPLARSNVVTQGKGRTRVQAALGAIMECLETWAGERIPEGMVALRPADALPEPWRGPHLRNSRRPGDRPEYASVRCVRGFALASGAEVVVPEALVATDYTPTAPARTSPLPRATTGLGAGTSAYGAILQGLGECIEREAFDRALRTHGFFQRRQIAPDTVDDPVLRAWIARCARAGTLTGIWQLDTIAGLAGFWIRLVEEDGPEQMLPLPADGMTVAADPTVAARKAFMEAAQGRIAAISGAREDITRAHYPRHVPAEALQAERRRTRPGPHARAFPPQDVRPAARPAAAVAAIVDALRAEGHAEPVAVPLAAIREGRHAVHVVRVVVPGFRIVPGEGMGGGR